MNRVQKVHLRLSTTLPSRKHFQPAPPEFHPGNASFGERHNRRAVIVDGKRYEALSAAGRALGVTRQHISYLLRTGRAKYAK